MTDREMLEFAAKAAGIDTKRCLQYEDGAFDWPGKVGRWNPLTDDGHALRLAVRLRLGLVHGWESFEEEPLSTVWISHDGQCLAEEAKKDDPLAATRRAIVRAAAEIGGQMK